MDKNFDELYELYKDALTYEIYFIEGVQYNLKLEDVQNLIGVKTKEDLSIFKKYLYYLDLYRCNFFYIESIDDTIEKFNSILEENEKDRESIIEMFKKQERLFCDENGNMKLKLVPKSYDIRIFNNWKQVYENVKTHDIILFVRNGDIYEEDDINKCTCFFNW